MRPGLRLKASGIWVECEHLSVRLAIERTYYLRYLSPIGYSQAKDHIRDETFPLHFKVAGPSSVDDSFIRISATDLPVTSSLVAVIEEWTEVERAQGKGKVISGPSTTSAVPAPRFLQPPDN